MRSPNPIPAAHCSLFFWAKMDEQEGSSEFRSFAFRGRDRLARKELAASTTTTTTTTGMTMAAILESESSGIQAPPIAPPPFANPREQLRRPTPQQQQPQMGLQMGPHAERTTAPGKMEAQSGLTERCINDSTNVILPPAFRPPHSLAPAPAPALAPSPEPVSSSSSHFLSSPTISLNSSIPPQTEDWSNFRFGSLGIHDDKWPTSASTTSPPNSNSSDTFVGTPVAELGPFEYPIHPADQNQDQEERERRSRGSFSSTGSGSGGGFTLSRRGSSFSTHLHSPVFHEVYSEAAAAPTGIEIEIDESMRHSSTLRRISTTSMVPILPRAGQRPTVIHSSTTTSVVPLTMKVGDGNSAGAGVPAVRDVSSGAGAGSRRGSVSPLFPNTNERRGSRKLSSSSSSSSSSYMSSQAQTYARSQTPTRTKTPSTSFVSDPNPTPNPFPSPSSPSLCSSSASASASSSIHRKTVQQIVSSIATASAAAAVQSNRRPSILLFSQQQPKEGPIPPSLLNMNLNSNTRRGSLPTNYLAALTLDSNSNSNTDHQRLSSYPSSLGPAFAHTSAASLHPQRALHPQAKASHPTSRLPAIGAGADRNSAPFPADAPATTPVSAAYLYNRRSSLATVSSTILLSPTTHPIRQRTRRRRSTISSSDSSARPRPGLLPIQDHEQEERLDLTLTESVVGSSDGSSDSTATVKSIGREHTIVDAADRYANAGDADDDVNNSRSKADGYLTVGRRQSLPPSHPLPHRDSPDNSPTCTQLPPQNGVVVNLGISTRTDNIKSNPQAGITNDSHVPNSSLTT